MTQSTLAAVPDLGYEAAKCRIGAVRCRTRAVDSANWAEEDAWLDLSAQWTALAEAFEAADRLSLN
jgi:hypothetical protein